MSQFRRNVSVAEFKVEASLLSQVDAFRLALMREIEGQVKEQKLIAIQSDAPSSLVWQSMVHHTLGSHHYFAFSGEGMAVFSPVSAACDEIQVDLVIGLTTDIVSAVGEQVCDAIRTFGPLFDDQFVGIPAQVVRAKIDLGFAVKEASK